MNALLIGDMHIRPQDIPEGHRLISFYAKLAMDPDVNYIVFMGDQCHYHDLNHNSVSEFWEESFSYLSKIKHVIVLVGNHDFEKGRTAHSMQHFKNLNNVTIVDDIHCFDDFLFISYQTNENFLKICKEYSNRSIAIVHQDFNGCQYENGWYAPNGIKPEDVPQKLIVSGHIHLHQKFSKVFYTGSPRWMTESDANINKYVWITDFKDKWQAFPTQEYASPIWHFEEFEGNELRSSLNHGVNPRVTVDLHGSVDFINKRKQFWMEKGIKVKTFPPKKYESKVKESEGLNKSFNNFLGGFNPPNGTSKERLKKLVKERINW